MPITIVSDVHKASFTDYGNGFKGSVTHADRDKQNPLSSGFMEVRESEGRAYNYSISHEISLVLEGELVLEDQAHPGEKKIAKKGSVVRIDRGTTARWSSPTYGKAFWVAQIDEDSLARHDEFVVPD
ncbi:uncharacterized protein LACBIDRAFT_294966 [Laccaria bicolor S238N-H82]|uniref:Predicted protein n=1 Tax=Laccaria bicolor (strain S238N-H82 / ATCC MYA-4686) TaxID=486041 RepID=B0DKJ5_LACBS|nr:uncharacterized protein LACBIDRAFT_294966 [Laccaria bicolor S238N-H82]EDR05079.1 predicted protein [Laccaria bicolor S238N-H82]|eukprot:XP_001884469.1 predicted protein [Laccaria bicolor S238N-H82]